MMGPKKLNAIRQQLKQALKDTTQNPGQWLEERIRAAAGPGLPLEERTKVLNSLRRVLEGFGKAKVRARRASSQ